MKKFSEVVKEYEERENRIVSPVPDIPIDADAGLNDEQAKVMAMTMAAIMVKNNISRI